MKLLVRDTAVLALVVAALVASFVFGQTRQAERVEVCTVADYCPS